MNHSSVVNVAVHVRAMAQRQPQTLAIVEPHGLDSFGRMRYRHFTFAELDAETNRLAAGLERIGIQRGMRIVLMVQPSLEFYALTFALFKTGAVIVLIDPGMGLKNLGVCLREAEPEAFIGIPKAHLARVLFGWGRDTLRHLVTVGPRLGWKGLSLAQVRRLGAAASGHRLAETQADETAAILFTSGSTGVAKGVVYTHGIFAAQVEMLKRLYGIEPGEIDLPTFPLFGLFGPALGMTTIIPEMDATRPGSVEPTKIINAIRYFGVTNLFGSPALIQRVGRYGVEHSVKLPTLRRVISAGAPVQATAIERFTTMLAEGVQVHTPYGATEALPVASIGGREILGETRQRTGEGGGVCVGRPVEGMRVKIIRISDEPIPAWSDSLELPRGEIGEIAVQGPVVTRSYDNRPQSTELAKIVEAAGGFWHRMGDVGYLDELGRLWFCGRKSQRVVTPAGTLFTIPCEGVFNAHPAVYRTALVGVERSGARQPVLCVEREKNSTIAEETLRRELLALGTKQPHTKAIQTILFHPAFPVDIRHNAKIFREKLAIWGGAAMAMTALVTGGGGFLGGAIVRRLVERGDHVRSLARGFYPTLHKLDVRQFQGDIYYPETVLRAAEGCDIVFHVAAKAGVSGPYQHYYTVNVEGTRNVLGACRSHGISRLVYTSSPSVVFDGRDQEGIDESVPYPQHYEAYYPQTKAIAERAVLEANSATLGTVALRPHLIWGPYDNQLVPRILARGRAGKLRRIGKQNKLIDTIYIDNAADAHLLAADRLAPGSAIAGKAYFLSQGEPLPLWDMVNRILAAGGVVPVTRSVPVSIAYITGWCCELLYGVLWRWDEPPLTRFVARELSTAHWFNLTAAKRDLCYEPRVSIDEGLRRLAEWLRRGSP